MNYPTLDIMKPVFYNSETMQIENVDQLCPRCTSENIIHESTEELEEYAHCRNCGNDFEIDYSKPF
jgi:transposase-like protein